MKKPVFGYDIRKKFHKNKAYYDADDILYMFADLKEMLSVKVEGGYYVLRAEDIGYLEKSLKESTLNNYKEHHGN